ncbi:MAG: hypothetical protein CVT64_10115 [Actinobacteria bacterium HGW-Actinobacteria-4]|nr:MAG: hypothetical protein CVT64_10115 [Actinobacteria bacterium HGW-Actinobacteria-4]
MTAETAESRVYRAALRATLASIGVLAVGGAAAGWVIAGGAGLTAALVGAGVAALSGASTQGAMMYGHRKGANALAVAVLGSWAVKMLLIIVALVVLQGIEDFHRPMFAAVAMTGVIVTLAIDVWVIHRARIPYAEPGSNQTHE